MAFSGEKSWGKYAVILLITLYIGSLLSIGAVWGMGEDPRAVVTGWVVDGSTGKPLNHALIIVERMVRGRLSLIHI